MRRLIVIQQASHALIILTGVQFACFASMAGYALNSHKPLMALFPLLLGLAFLALLYRLVRRLRVAAFDVDAGTVALAPMFSRLTATRTWNLRTGDALLRIGSGPRGKVRLLLAGAPAADSADSGELVRLGWFNEDQIPPELRALARQGDTAFSA